MNWNKITSWTERGESSDKQKTPNIKTIIQEIVNLEDWKSRNAIALFVSGTGKRVVESFDGD